MKQLSLVLLVFSLFLFLGCTQVPTCGDGICNGSETPQTCISDCGNSSVETGYLQVYVTDANTGWFLEGVEVNFAESKLDACSLNISAKPIVVNTNSEGLAEIKLEAEKNYVAVIKGDYYPIEYECAMVFGGKTSIINYSLVKLPAKPLCQQLAGTREVAVGEAIDVNGGSLYPNQAVKIYLYDWVLEGSASDFNYNWVQMYNAKWLLRDENNNASEYVQVLPPTNLKTKFTNDSFYNDINFLTTCWKEGNDLPFAVISTN